MIISTITNRLKLSLEKVLVIKSDVHRLHHLTLLELLELSWSI